VREWIEGGPLSGRPFFFCKARDGIAEAFCDSEEKGTIRQQRCWRYRRHAWRAKGCVCEELTDAEYVRGLTWTMRLTNFLNRRSKRMPLGFVTKRWHQAAEIYCR
jgi:hypothetical protein